MDAEETVSTNDDGDCERVSSEVVDSSQLATEHRDVLHDSSDGSLSYPGGLTVRRKSQEMGRAEFLAILSTNYPRPAELKSVNVNRIQVYETFGCHYLPRVKDRLGTVDWFIGAAQSEQSQALAHAISSVCTHIYYRVSDDSRHLQAASAEYARAIRCARREMILVQPKTVRVATAHILTVCELFSQASLDDTGASAHAQYVLSLTEADRGADDAIHTKHLSAATNVRIYALWESIILRRCPVRPRQLPTGTEQLHPPGTLEALVSLTLTTVSTLATGDRLCEQEQAPSLPCMLQQLQDIARLEGKLHDWTTSYAKKKDFPLYWVVAVQRQPPPIMRGTETLFRHTYEFPHFQDAIACITYWMCLLALSQMQVKMMDMYQHKLATEHAYYIRLRRTSEEYADSICMTMSYVARLENGWAGRLTSIRPLRFLSLYYKRQKDWRKLVWVTRCAEDIGVLRPQPNTSPPGMHLGASDAGS